MNDYRNKKRQKMRARRRRAQRIKMTGMCIATLIVFIFIVFLAISNLSKIKKNVTLEAGSEINIKDFLKKENADAKFVTDVSQINTGNIGSHEIVVKVGKKEYTSKLTIEDTKAPTAKANDVTVNKDGQIEANQFVTDIKDATKVDVSFKDKPDVSKDGESEVIIVLTDEGKNQKEVKAKLTVVSDSEPPVIDGVKDITAYIGETVSYKKDVTVTDNMDQNPTLDIDNSKVNLNKAGTYEVVYTATDSAGNTSSASSKITIKEKPKGYVDKEDVYALAQKVVDQITNDSMTDMEKAFAIYRWTKTNIGYTGTSNKDSWTIGAYQAFTKKSGDCFNYYAAAKAMLDVCGIQNVDIVKSDTSHSAHYWSLINLGDGWYHFDATPRKGGGNFFMLTDAELAAYSTKHKNSHIFDSSLYPERATVSVQDKINYAKGTINK